MTDRDASTTSRNEPRYRIIIDGDHVREDAMKAIVQMSLGSSHLMCSMCGAIVTVSKKKAEKLRKRKRVTIFCKKCKKAIKARRRGR